MAVFSESVTTIESVEYTTPVYLQNADNNNLYYKIYDTNKMIVVDTTTGKESISIKPYPGNGITQVTDAELIVEGLFITAYGAVKTIIDAL